MKNMNTVIGLKNNRNNTRAPIFLGCNSKKDEETVIDTTEYILTNRLLHFRNTSDKH